MQCANPHETISYRLIMATGGNFSDYMNEIFTLSYGDTTAKISEEILSGDWIDTHFAKIVAAYAPEVNDSSYTVPYSGAYLTVEYSMEAEDYEQDYWEYGEGSSWEPRRRGHEEGLSEGSNEIAGDYSQESDAVIFKIETKCLMIGSFYCGSFCR